MNVVVKKGDEVVLTVEGLEAFPQTITYDALVAFAAEKLAQEYRMKLYKIPSGPTAVLGNAGCAGVDPSFRA